MPFAPVVIRHGHMVIHCNDPGQLGTILQQISSTSAASDAEVTSQVLSAHEKMLSLGRQHGIATMGALSAHLARRGHVELSRRVRTAARTRGAHAHPDLDAHSEVLRNWLPESLQDDRTLRRKASADGSKAVERPTDAVPSGGSGLPPSDAAAHG